MPIFFTAAEVSIHPLSVIAYPLQGHRRLEPVPADIGREAVYILNWSPGNHRTCCTASHGMNLPSQFVCIFLYFFVCFVCNFCCTFLTLAAGLQEQLAALLATPLMACLLTCLPPNRERPNKDIYLNPSENF